MMPSEVHPRAGFAPGYWLHVAAYILIGFAIVHVLGAVLGCELPVGGLQGDDATEPEAAPTDYEGDNLQVEDRVVHPEDVTTPEDEVDAGAEDAGAEDAMEPETDVPEGADADAEVEGAPDAGPEADAEEEVDGPTEISECDPEACTATCAGYGYPYGNCDGYFCLCDDYPPDADAGTDDAGPPREDCFNRRDDDDDGLVDCFDPDCGSLIYCRCEPLCGAGQICRAGECVPFP